MGLIPIYLDSLRPYEAGLSIEEVQRRTGRRQVIKLASNENPLGPSPLAVEAMAAALSNSHRYPSRAGELREAIAARHGVKPANVVLGSGSEGILSDIIRTFLCDEDEVLTSEGTFTGIRVLTEGRGVPFRTVPMKRWGFDLEALASAIGPRTKIVYLANPNNPTGTIFSASDFETFHHRVPPRVLILLDEAYFEYAEGAHGYPDSLNYRFDNVITLRTFSKVHGLAGVRLGYGFAHGDLVANLNKIKLPFEPSAIAEAAGLAAIHDTGFVARSVERNAVEMRHLVAELKKLSLDPIPSFGNFVLVPFETPTHAKNVFDELLDCGVIVRHLRAFGLPRCLRITVGAEAENQELIRCLKQVALPALV